MNKIFFFILIFSITLLFSCKGKKQGIQILDEEQFENMLIDIHIADGILSSRNINKYGLNYRPSYYYNSIYKKYNITPEQFDSCLLYYSQDLHQFTKIYDRIIDSLNRLETKLQIDLKNEELLPDTLNLWTKRTHWKISQESRANLEFTIPVKESGTYTIKAIIKIFEDDQTEDPQMTAYFWKEDTLNGPNKVFFKPITLKKTPGFLTYQMQLVYPDSTFSELRGNLFSGKNKTENFNQHFEMKNIMIFNPKIKADSLGLKEKLEDSMLK